MCAKHRRPLSFNMFYLPLKRRRRVWGHSMRKCIALIPNAHALGVLDALQNILGGQELSKLQSPNAEMTSTGVLVGEMLHVHLLRMQLIADPKSPNWHCSLRACRGQVAVAHSVKSYRKQPIHGAPVTFIRLHFQSACSAMPQHPRTALR